jgi:hypothetical protein
MVLHGEKTATYAPELKVYWWECATALTQGEEKTFLALGGMFKRG